MTTHYVDANIFLRYLTQDDPQKAEQARQLILQLQAGTVVATTCEGVLVEVVQVLSSTRLYNLPRDQIRRHLRNILALPGLRLAHKRTYLRALDLYVATRLDFVDVLQVAHMERLKLTQIVSFDRDFDRIAGITRVEPPLTT